MSGNPAFSLKLQCCLQARVIVFVVVVGYIAIRHAPDNNAPRSRHCFVANPYWSPRCSRLFWPAAGFVDGPLS